MTKKGLYMGFLVVLMVIMSTAPAKSQSESRGELIKYYENCIVKKINNCKGKTVLKTSKSVNLQRKADLATRQITFLMTNKNMLIHEMVEQEISPKQYKVEYYLNKRFYEMIR